MKQVTPLAAIMTLLWGSSFAAPLLGQEPPKGRAKKTEASEKVNPAVENELEVRYGPNHAMTQQLGVRIRALGGSVKDAYGTLQFPTPWPEQSMRIVKEEVSPGIRATKERETGLLKQFLFHVPFIDAGKEESVQFTIEYIRKDVLPPEDTSAFVIPKKVDKELKIYLTDSPKLDPKAGKVMQTLKEIGAELEEGATAWDKVEAVYNWVKENVARHQGDGVTTAEVLKNKKGNSEDIVATFVALCRAARIPARMVWLTEGVSAEFYLQDESGKGRWFPCSFGAKNEFGFSTIDRPIMLKGDSFRVPADMFQVPEQKGEQRQIWESLKCAAAAPGGGKPQVDFMRQVLPSATAALPGQSALGQPTPGQPAPPGAPPAGAPPADTQPEKKPGDAFIPIPGSSPPK